MRETTCLPYLPALVLVSWFDVHSVLFSIQTFLRQRYLREKWFPPPSKLSSYLKHNNNSWRRQPLQFLGIKYTAYFCLFFWRSIFTLHISLLLTSNICINHMVMPQYKNNALWWILHQVLLENSIFWPEPKSVQHNYPLSPQPIYKFK